MGQIPLDMHIFVSNSASRSLVEIADAKGERFHLRALEAGVGHHGEEFIAGFERGDGFGEMFVRPGGISCDPSGSSGHDAAAIEVVKPSHWSKGGLAKLEDDQSAFGFEDAEELIDGSLRCLDIPDTKGDRDDIKG